MANGRYMTKDTYLRRCRYIYTVRIRSYGRYIFLPSDSRNVQRGKLSCSVWKSLKVYAASLLKKYKNRASVPDTNQALSQCIRRHAASRLCVRLQNADLPNNICQTKIDSIANVLKFLNKTLGCVQQKSSKNQ